MSNHLTATVLAGVVATAATAQTDAPSGTLPDLALSPAFPQLTFNRPVFIGHAGDRRLFVIEQNGRILVFPNRSDVQEATDFLDIRPRVRRMHNEEGLLGLAFHPRHHENGYFYVCYSASDPRRGVLSRFELSVEDPDLADPDSETVILEVEQPYGNHNGSTVLFGKDGYLYASFGDGGWANDPENNGQDLSTLLGSIVRIDVDREDPGRAYAVPKDNPFTDREDARPEIWAYGLRNVWRMSFDRETGDLWAGDVGQNSWEEIDLIVKGGNYGWRVREGAHAFRDETPTGPMIDPVVEYPRREGRELLGMSVTGGCVYRGSLNPNLHGAYVYGDYVTGRIWALRMDGDRVVEHRQVFMPPPRVFISSFGEDAEGELYLCSFDGLDGRGGGRGRIFRLVEK